MNIHVLFVGILAEVTQTGSRHYRNVSSFGDLRLRIEDNFPEIVHYNYLIAVNNEIINDSPVLRDGDEIAFLPPFGGFD
jgi:molybdopterin converting factor small subunit